MLSDKAAYYRRKGCNCSQCLVKAAESEYKITLSHQVADACQGLSSGLGVGELCDVLIAGVMVFGLLFDETATKRMRLKLLTRFAEENGHMDCGSLKKTRSKNGDCGRIVREIADMVEEIIMEERESTGEINRSK